MQLLQNGLKSVTIGYSYNIIPRCLANAIGCLRDNTSLKELTISPGRDLSEVHLTTYH